MNLIHLIFDILFNMNLFNMKFKNEQSNLWLSGSDNHSFLECSNQEGDSSRWITSNIRFPDLGIAYIGFSIYDDQLTCTLRICAIL